MTKDILVLAELAYPWLTGWVVEVGILLLYAALAGSVLVEFGCATSGLSRRRGLLWWWGSRRPTCGAIGKGRGRVGACPVHIWACLSALGRHHRGIGADWRAGAGGLGVGLRHTRVRVGTWWLRILAVFLARPDHFIRRVRAAGKGKLRLVGAVLCSFLLQEAHVLVTVGWWGGCGVGDGSRDDAALLRGS